MANIDDFKANLIGGGARANQFRVTITPPPGIAIGLDVRRTSFLVTASNLPGMTLAEIAIPFRGRSIYIAGVKHLQMLNEKILTKNLHFFKVDKVKFSPRWGSRRWGRSNYLTPNLELVFYAKSEGETEIIIYKDDKIKKSIDIDVNKGLNFINYDLSVDIKEKSTTDNGITYLKKGDYRIEIIQGDNSSEEKLIIN